MQIKNYKKKKNGHEGRVIYPTPGRRQSKMPKLSRNGDKKSIETVFLIAICRSTGNKWQSNLSIFDQLSLIVDYIFDCCLPGVYPLTTDRQTHFKSSNRRYSLHYLVRTRNVHLIFPGL